MASVVGIEASSTASVVVFVIGTAMLLAGAGVLLDLAVLHRWVPDPGKRLAVLVVWSVASILVLQALVVIVVRA